LNALFEESSEILAALTHVQIRDVRHQDFLADPAFDRVVPGFSGDSRRRA